MQAVALCLILFSFLALLIAYRARKQFASVTLIVMAGYLFSIGTMYGTTHTAESSDVVVHGYTAKFGWPISFAVQTDNDTPLIDGTVIAFRVGGVVGSEIDILKMHMNTSLFIILFCTVIKIIRYRTKHHA